MTQTRTNTRPCLLRRSSGRYDDRMWELLKNMYRNGGDKYPKNAGTYRVEFLDGPVSAARRFEMFVERMPETMVITKQTDIASIQTEAIRTIQAYLTEQKAIAETMLAALPPVPVTAKSQKSKKPAGAGQS